MTVLLIIVRTASDDGHAAGRNKKISISGESVLVQKNQALYQSDLWNRSSITLARKKHDTFYLRKFFQVLAGLRLNG